MIILIYWYLPSVSYGDSGGSRALYTPPVTPWEWGIPEVGRLTARRPLTTVCFMTGVKS